MAVREGAPSRQSHDSRNLRADSPPDRSSGPPFTSTRNIQFHPSRVRTAQGCLARRNHRGFVDGCGQKATYRYYSEARRERPPSATIMCLAQNRGVRFSIDVPQSSIPIQADAEALRRAFLILMNNAAKYTPSSGSVKVTLASRDGCAQGFRLGHWNRYRFARHASSLRSLLARGQSSFPRTGWGRLGSVDRQSGSLGCAAPFLFRVNRGRDLCSRSTCPYPSAETR